MQNHMSAKAQRLATIAKKLKVALRIKPSSMSSMRFTLDSVREGITSGK
jgi:hypothetical protein